MSLVVVVRNQADTLAALLTILSEQILTLTKDFELIVVDNASKDDSINVLKTLAQPDGLPNLQIYMLTDQVEQDTASWVGLENALGDFVAVLDPHFDNVNMIPEMIEAALSGNDIVFARNLERPLHSAAYRSGRFVFNMLYKWFNGIRLADENPSYRLLSRNVVNFIMQHPSPVLFYRRLYNIAGFTQTCLEYRAQTMLPSKPKFFIEHFELGLRLLISSSNAPLRLVTLLSLFGAFANLVYSIYVIIVYITHADVTPGWATLSLQQSGMFMLFSFVFLVLGEYILHLTSESSRSSLYHIAQEFNSVRITRHQKLNVEEDAAAIQPTGQT